MKENNNNSHLTRQQSNAKQEKGNLNEMLNRVHYAPEQRRHVLQNTSIHHQDTHSLTSCQTVWKCRLNFLCGFALGIIKKQIISLFSPLHH